jgi:hypothetical protein
LAVEEKKFVIYFDAKTIDKSLAKKFEEKANYETL